MDFSALPNINTTNPNNFFLIAGPCAIEGGEMAFEIAEKINRIAQKLEIPYIFKGSFKKPIAVVLIALQGLETKRP